MTEATEAKPTPYASWVSVICGLIAVGLALYVLLSGDVLEALKTAPKDDPLLMASLIQGIVGTLAAIVALARKEPWRLAVLGLAACLVGIAAKFVLAIVAAAIVVALAMAVIAAID